jgi:hypothetical protein
MFMEEASGDGVFELFIMAVYVEASSDDMMESPRADGWVVLTLLTTPTKRCYIRTAFGSSITH